MYAAYWDASGKPGSKVMAMAGFVSRVSKWDRFENEWAKLLPDGIPSFHMTDFASSRKGWESWKGQSEARWKLFASLVDCIKRNTNKGFGISLQMSDYVASDRKYELSEAIAGPYSLLGCACLSKLRKWADRHNVDHTKIRCVFEDGDEGIGALIHRARFDGFNAISQSKKDIRAFDSCDLAAWRTKALMDDGLIKRLQDEDPIAAERIERSFKQISEVVQLNEVVDAETLEKMCVVGGVPKRGTTGQC
jgi:hypothetical protein